MSDLSADTFEPHDGSTFTAPAENGAELTLVSVERGLAQEGMPRDPFSLWFTSAPDVSLPQGTYTLEHGTLGTLELFIVPRSPKADGLPRYEAVFN